MKPNFALPAGMSNAAKRPKIFHGCVDGVFSALLTMVNKTKICTPPETIIPSEKWWLEDELSFWGQAYCQGQVRFREGTHNEQMAQI